MHALALWRLGRRSEAYALLEAAAGPGGDAVAQLRGKRGWLRCADDDLGRGRADLEAAAEAELRLGALSIGAIHLTTLARAHYAAGAWEDAVVAAERAVAISSELEHAPGRAFVWWGAVAVPAARGDWAAADAYAARGAAEPIDAPDRVVAAGMAQALPAVARGDAAAVIRVLEPIARLSGLAVAPAASPPGAASGSPGPASSPPGATGGRSRRLAGPRRAAASRRPRRVARPRVLAARALRADPPALARRHLRGPPASTLPASGPGRTSMPTRSSPPGGSPTPTHFLAPHEALAAESGTPRWARGSRGCAGGSRPRTGTRTPPARPSSVRSS